jgi:formiminoglutamase
MSNDWLTIRQAETPLILAMPHGGTILPDGLADRFVSGWLARRDTDWHIADLYEGLADATVVATAISRSVIDVNRDPSGVSLYPGLTTTALCPTTSFDGEALYLPGNEPDAAEISARRIRWFDPYHAALAAEIKRLKAFHPRVVVYDCHSIRSVVPLLFSGKLPALNIGTNGGATCDPALRNAVACAAVNSGRSHVVDGRFRGGWTTRHYGAPENGVHAIQMETAMRSYLAEPSDMVNPDNWPPEFQASYAAALRETLSTILSSCMDFAQ